MDWTLIEDLYLAIRGIFDGFFNFLMKVIGEAE